MAAPTATDLSAFVGKQLDAGQANAALGLALAMAQSYTRGQGFTAGEPNNDVRAVILLAAARLVADPAQITTQRQMGPFVVQYSGDHSMQWTTAELSVLNRYRARAQ